MNYIFYDTETTGLDPHFDQILQFAAILTDENFKEIESINIRAQLITYILPSVGGLMATRIPVANLTDKSLPTHYEAIKQIHAKLSSWSPAIFIGHNSIKYDEEILRNSFFQTLHSAYLTNTNGNHRADMINIAVATHIFAPESIKVPLNEKGKEVFKLGPLSRANGFNDDNAHEALADVRMTVKMAELIKSKAPKVWDEMIFLGKKGSVFNKVISEPSFYLSERHTNRISNFLVTFCGMHSNKDCAVFDLSYNPDDYTSLTVDELVEVLKGTKKPIRSLNAHKQPILMSTKDYKIEIKDFNLTQEEINRRINVIKENNAFRIRVGEALGKKYDDKEESVFLEQKIYSGGFISKEDEQKISTFKEFDWRGRALVAEQIADSRIKEFARRLVFLENPEMLTKEVRENLQKWSYNRLHTEEEVPWTTLKSALAEIEKFQKDIAGNDLKYLNEIKGFIENRE